MAGAVWTIERIKEGIDRYFEENGHYPTAVDFDETTYLPTARQVQRRFGGMQSLREHLGYTETNYTKGTARKVVYQNFVGRSLDAEDMLEMALVERFGEPYVHTQKRYYKLLKNRWDFFVYYQNGYMGIDIFSTSRTSYIMKNVHHKLLKYADVPPTVPIYFVVENKNITDDDIEKATFLSESLRKHSNIHVVTLNTFLEEVITRFEPLALPDGISLVLT